MRASLVTRQGRTLEDIKNDPGSVAPFAASLCEFAAAFLGPNLASGDWCLCTTPRRRHAGGFHFATEVCRAASAMLGIPFREDVATARTRARIDAEISLANDQPERDVPPCGVRTFLPHPTRAARERPPPFRQRT